MSNEIENRPHRHRGSLLGPIVLITLGIVFLLNNLGLITGDVWEMVVLLWPLILVAIGLDGLLRRDGLVGAAFMVGLGVIFLLSNFGYLSLSIWEMALRLWPLLLIAVGFDIVIGRRSLIASIIGLVVILALLGGALWFFGFQLDRGQALQGETVSQPLAGANQARLVIEPAAGALDLNALPAGSDLISGTVPARRGARVSQDFTQQADSATFTLRSTGAVFVQPDERWRLGVTPEIPLDLQVSMGAGDANLDLTGLQIENLDINLGVGQVTVTLPAEGQFEASVEGAIGQLVVIVPPGMETRIESDAAIANVDVPDDFEKDGSVYLSPGYAGAQNRVELSVGQAIGSIVIQR